MSNIRKITAALLVLSVFLFALSGCSSSPKEPITAETFNSTMQENNFTVTDATSQFEAGLVNSVTIAVNKAATYQIEFYVVPSAERARSSYEQNRVHFKELKGSAAVETEVFLPSYARYTLTSDGKFYIVSQIGNTFIFAQNIASSDKAEVEDILKELGY
ncbi:MAG: hypothetical protein LBL82_08515 [Oscillospiraceae bacterium]|jgi:hypothetical protein|nr:hypothetical protein [Oscillospiraceae bacterium]